LSKMLLIAVSVVANWVKIEFAITVVSPGNFEELQSGVPCAEFRNLSNYDGHLGGNNYLGSWRKKNICKPNNEEKYILFNKIVAVNKKGKRKTINK